MDIFGNRVVIIKIRRKEVSFMETIEFYNGHTMPKVGIGTFRVENNDECKEQLSMQLSQVIVVLIQLKYMVMKNKLV